MAIITGIEESRGIYTLYADGRAALRLPKKYFAQRPLQEGDPFDAEAYTDSIAALQASDAYESALSSLDRCARTERQIRQTLARKGYVDPAVDAVVERLKGCGLIDDPSYARRMAESQQHKPEGIYAFRRKLAAKGISEEDAESALESLTDEQQQAMALQAARKLLRKYEDLPERERKAKLSQALARKGFTWDTISSAMETLDI